MPLSVASFRLKDDCIQEVDTPLSIVVFSPLLQLSPPPSSRDYYFNLDDTEGVTDLFDVPLNNFSV